MTQVKKNREYLELGEPRIGLTNKRILETIRETGRRGLSVIELSYMIGADIFLILDALKQLQKQHLISVRVKYAVHWCYPLQEVA